jgi:hypothetical protein
MTAVTRYLQRLEETWAQRVGKITGVRPDADTEEEMGTMALLDDDESTDAEKH